MALPAIAGNSLQFTRRQQARSQNCAALFAGELTKGTIAIFNRRGDQIGSIKTGIGFMATDPSGNLYLSVVNEYSEDIKIYAPPYTTKACKVIHEPAGVVGFGYFMAFDREGNLFFSLTDGRERRGLPRSEVGVKPARS